MLTPAASFAQNSIQEAEVQFVFGSPGELTIEAGDTQSAFPTMEAPLSFVDWTEFGHFMEDVFNAQVTFHPGTPVPTIRLVVAVLGAPLVFDAATGSAVEVTNPVNEFIGGPTGYASIGGTSYCFNQRLCGSGSGGAAATAVQTTSLTASGIRVAGVSIRGAPQSFTYPAAVGRTWEATTRQIEGGYLRFIASASSGWRKCVTVGRFTLCYYVPLIVTTRKYHNYLTVDMALIEDQGSCFDELERKFESKADVPSVSVDVWAYVSEEYQEDYDLYMADGMKSVHSGHNPDDGSYHSVTSVEGAGDWVTPTCP